MLLSIWDGLQPREIATVLGLTPVTTRARLSRARRRLERAVRCQLDDCSDPAPVPLLERTAR